MSNHSKIYLLFIVDEAGAFDAQATIENLGLKPLIDQLQQEGSLEVIPQGYTIGDPLPKGFILLSAPAQLSPFIEALEESKQIDAVKRILPLQVPLGTALAAINKYPFPAIVEYGDFFMFNENKTMCSLIIDKDQKGHYDGTGEDLIGRAHRTDGQDLVKVIGTINRERT
jgi:hypothetical protein